MNNLPDAGLDATPPTASNDLSLLDFLFVLASGLRWLVLVPVLVAALAVGLSFLTTPQFTSTTSILPPQQQQSTAAGLLGALGGLSVGGGGGGGGLSALAGLKNPNDQWIALLKSRTIADALIKEFDLKSRYEAEYMLQARDRLAKRTKIEAGKDNLINISVDDEDPKRAAALASGYIKQLQQMMKTLAVTEAAQRRVFFEHQLQDVKVKLTKAQSELQSTGVSVDVLKASPQTALAGVAVVKAQLAATEVKLSMMRGVMTEASPELQQVQREMASLREQLRRLEQTDTIKPSADNNGYIAKFREFKYQETLMELMARQYEFARADEAREGNLIQVVDQADIPERKSKPKRASIAVLAGLTGLLATLLFLFIRQALRQTRANPVAHRKLQAVKAALWGRKPAA